MATRDASELPAELISAEDDIASPTVVSTWYTGAWVGAAAALTAAGVSLWVGRNVGGVIVAQLLADRVTALVPVSLFGSTISALESNAKALSLVGLTLAQVLVGAGIGVGYGWVGSRRSFARVAGAVGLTVFVWAIFSLIVAPLGNAGVLARDAQGGMLQAQLLFLLTAATFGFVTAALVPWPVEVSEASPSRRRMLMTTAVVIPAVVAGGYVGWFARWLRESSAITPAPIAAEDAAAQNADDPYAFAGMPQPITPVGEFYVVSKNFVDPSISSSDWSLEISGLVERPLNLSYSDLLARPSIEFISTLECISNPVGGDYISTAQWQGVPLATLLDEAGLLDDVVDLELHAGDGYVESIPLAEGIAPDTVLVHSMNGEPLIDKHGFPARLIVPGIYGMKNVKWLTKVIAVDEDILGYWQQRGWSDPAPVLTMSRIDAPRAYSEVPVGQPFAIGGIAFSGDRGITRVEVSVDKGATWVNAELSAPLSDLSWRLWRFDYTPDRTGGLSITTRATDGTGDTQTSERQPPLPNGSTGYHTITVKVV